jgi:hypothetical protein
MKKIFLLVIFLISANFLAFSQIQESWLSLGFEFGNSFVKYPDEGFSYLGSPGINLNQYVFYNNKNIGLFGHLSFLFPAIEKHNDTNYDYLFQYEWMIGPAFRHGINDKLHLRFAIGLNVTWPFDANFSKESTDYRLTAANIGIGGDVGIKYDFSYKYYLNIGLALAYNFINSTIVDSISDDRKVRTRVSEDLYLNYVMIGIRPYIGIGINMYGEGMKYGKPPKN